MIHALSSKTFPRQESRSLSSEQSNETPSHPKQDRYCLTKGWKTFVGFVFPRVLVSKPSDLPQVPILSIDLAKLETIKKTESKPIVLTVSIEPCEPCKALKKEIRKMLHLLGKVTFAELRVKDDELPEVADRMGIKSFPTMLVLQSGQERKRFQGYGKTTTAQLEGVLKELLKKAGKD